RHVVDSDRAHADARRGAGASRPPDPPRPQRPRLRLGWPTQHQALDEPAVCVRLREGAMVMSEAPMPLWEVFIRNRSGLPHKHCGSVHAPDATMALQAARDVYTRRGEA